MRCTMTLKAALLTGWLIASASQVALSGNPALKVTANDGAFLDNFGAAVAIDGTTAIVGAPLDDENGQGDRGSAYLYDITTGQELAKLGPSEPFANGYLFGFSVDIEGATAIVGAPFKNQVGTPGSAYLFNSSSGQLLADLSAIDGAQADHFGTSVGVSGALAVVGAPGDDDNGSGSGSAYIFDASTGAQLFKLLPNDGAAGDAFGGSVGISGQLIVVSSGGDTENGSGSGSAYVFDATTGLQLFKLLPNDGAPLDRFACVAIHGTTIIVGASGDDDNGLNSGSAYLFDGTTGLQTSKLLANDGAAGDGFGAPVGISATHAVCGASGKNGVALETGAAYVFDLASGQEDAELQASDANSFDRFGSAVAVSDGVVVAGSAGDDYGVGCCSNDTGSAYIYDLNNASPWRTQGKALSGSAGLPFLWASGPLTDNSPLSVSLTNGAPNTSITLVLGFASFFVSFKGGTLVPTPDLLLFGLATGGSGSQQINSTWPAGVPSCVTFYMQYWIADGTGPFGFAASNGLSGTTP